MSPHVVDYIENAFYVKILATNWNKFNKHQLSEIWNYFVNWVLVWIPSIQDLLWRQLFYLPRNSIYLSTPNQEKFQTIKWTYDFFFFTFPYRKQIQLRVKTSDYPDVSIWIIRTMIWKDASDDSTMNELKIIGKGVKQVIPKFSCEVMTVYHFIKEILYEQEPSFRLKPGTIQPIVSKLH